MLFVGAECLSCIVLFILKMVMVIELRFIGGFCFYHEPFGEHGYGTGGGEHSQTLQQFLGLLRASPSIAV